MMQWNSDGSTIVPDAGIQKIFESISSRKNNYESLNSQVNNVQVILPIHNEKKFIVQDSFNNIRKKLNELQNRSSPRQ